MNFELSDALEPERVAETLDLMFTGEIWSWRGPAPWYFATVPADASVALHAMSKDVSYGWGMIPVRARIAGSVWETSLFPKEGRYVVPIKSAVRRAERLAEGDTVTVQLSIRP